MESARRQQPVIAPCATGVHAPVYRLWTLGGMRLEGPSGPVAGLRRKERLLLVYLARAAAPVRRSELLALLWGSQPEARARHGLRQALCALRRVVPEAICAGSELACVVCGSVELDLAELEQAVADGRPAPALALWGGEFLPDLEDAGDEPLRAWIAAERAALRRLVDGALDAAVAGLAPCAGVPEPVLQAARRQAEAQPWDEASQLRLVRLLAAAGRVAEAVAQHARSAERLREEMAHEPTAAFMAAAAELGACCADPVEAAWARVRAGGSAVVRLDGAAPWTSPPVLEDGLILHAAGGALPAAPWGVARRLLAPLRGARGLSAACDHALAEVAELVPSLRERYPSLPVPTREPAALHAAVRQVLGEVAAESPVALVLEDGGAADGETRALVADLEADLPAGVLLVLVEPAREPAQDAAVPGDVVAAAGDVLPDVPVRPPAAAVRVRRLLRWAIGAAAALVVALGLARLAAGDEALPSADAGALAYYDAGLRLLRENDGAGALRLLSEALERDSSFALAAYFAGRAAGQVSGQGAAQVLLRRAEALAAGATERDRLFIRTAVALQFNDPAASAQAAELAGRYPDDAESVLLVAGALVQEGSFAAAARALERVIAMDSTAESVAAGRCARCDAHEQLVAVLWAADSVEAALAAARRWVDAQPADAAPLLVLAAHLAALDRYTEAAAVRRRAALLGGGGTDDLVAAVTQDIRSADFANADQGLEVLARAGGPDLRRRAAWLQAISFRNQRRIDDAWRAATAYRAAGQGGGAAIHPFATPQAVVLLEAGEPRRAAAMFDTMFHQVGDLGRPSRTARDQAWLLTLRASALAAAGDTALLPSLADSIHALGLRSGYGRDRRLHHHVRGLLHAARGDLHAAEREFRSAIHSPTTGYTRTNVELARVLLRQGRPTDAVPPLRSALRAPVDGPALYVTRTETYELLARAYRAAGDADSAAFYGRLVAASVGAARAHRDAAPLVARH